MQAPKCPKCESENFSKAGIVKNRQRFRCKDCGYYFTVSKLGKEIDSYYVIKALQLHIEGVSYREIERILGVSHVSVMNWVKKYGVKAPQNYEYRPTYKVVTHAELLDFLADPRRMKASGLMLTELGDKYMMIKWERFKG